MMTEIIFSGVNCPIGYSIAGLMEGSENVKRVDSLFFPRLDHFCLYHNHAFSFPPCS